MLSTSQTCRICVTVANCYAEKRNDCSLLTGWMPSDSVRRTCRKPHRLPGRSWWNRLLTRLWWPPEPYLPLSDVFAETFATGQRRPFALEQWPSIPVSVWPSSDRGGPDRRNVVATESPPPRPVHQLRTTWANRTRRYIICSGSIRSVLIFPNDEVQSRRHCIRWSDAVWVRPSLIHGRRSSQDLDNPQWRMDSVVA